MVTSESFEFLFYLRREEAKKRLGLDLNKKKEIKLKDIIFRNLFPKRICKFYVKS